MAIMITNLYISLFLLCRLSRHSDEIWFGLKRKQWQLLLRLFSFNAWKMIIYILHRGKTEWLDVAYGQAVYLTEIISSYVMMAFLVRKYIIYSEKKPSHKQSEAIIKNNFLKENLPLFFQLLFAILTLMWTLMLFQMIHKGLWSQRVRIRTISAKEIILRILSP